MSSSKHEPVQQQEKALALQLAHISNVYVKLLEQHAQTRLPQQSRLPSDRQKAASEQMGQAWPAANGLQPQELHQFPTSDSQNMSTKHRKQHRNPSILAYQQELVSAILKNGNSVLFLPTGTSWKSMNALHDTVSMLLPLAASCRHCGVTCMHCMLWLSCGHTHTADTPQHGCSTAVLHHAGTGQAVVAAGAAQQLLLQSPHKHVIYLTDRVHLLYQQAAAFSAQLGIPVGRWVEAPPVHTAVSYPTFML